MSKVKSHTEDGWIRCGNCGHKLMKIIGTCICDHAPAIEMKCHSCKAINDVSISNDKIRRTE